jgi:4-amino-4-deoxy-L-arabinose transferase-like glycosyltransferase
VRISLNLFAPACRSEYHRAIISDENHSMKQFVRAHPLLFVLILAAAIRVPAVLYSKGYMASDDHYETVQISYKWLQTGLWDSDGHLSWDGRPGIRTARFPLYNLGLYGVMRGYQAIGINDLDTMMYGIRALHAFLSLLSVWGAFKLAEIATRSKRWGLIAGLVMAGHFALPYLGVRNLIEMVSGHFWLLSLLCLYAYQYGEKKTGYLIGAGLLTGLAWMIRFEISTAAIVLPFILWYLEKNIRPAVWYSVGVAIILLLSGFMDWSLLGFFAASTINHIGQINAESAIYETTPFIYLLLLFGLLLPPFSFFATYLGFRNGFWKRHLILIGTIGSFVIIHTVQESRQERYIIPMLVPALLVAILALARDWETGGISRRRPRLLAGLVIPAVVLNVILLPILTLNYSKKGEVEPLAAIEHSGVRGGVLLVSPDVGRFYPLAYSGFETRRHEYVNSWPDLARLREPQIQSDSLKFAVLYPGSGDDLKRYVDSVSRVVGPLTEWKYISPSPIDWTVHRLNPTHNRSNGAWVYRIGQP